MVTELVLAALYAGAFIYIMRGGKSAVPWRRMITLDEGTEHVTTILDELEDRMDSNEYNEMLCALADDINQRVEMIQKSGQELSPCVEIDGHMLADVSGEEVEAWMLQKGIVQPNHTSTDVPTDRGCSDEEHAAQRADIPVQFKG